MSGATPKSQAKNPIDIDVFLVCRKQSCDNRPRKKELDAFAEVCRFAALKVERFNSLGRTLSKNDIKVVLYSQLLVELSPGRQRGEFLSDFDKLSASICDKIEELYDTQSESLLMANGPTELQLTLF